MPKSRHQKGGQTAALLAGVSCCCIDGFSDPLQTEIPSRTTVPVPSREKQTGFLLRSPKGETGVAGVNCHGEIFLVPPRAKAQASAPVQRRAALHRLSSDSLVPPWPLCPALLRRPVKKATVFFQAHPATAACAANHKSQRRHWRLADSDDALTWLSPLSRAHFLPRDGVK
jgi:hypothetical protein